jgi:hypothetical protein
MSRGPSKESVFFDSPGLPYDEADRSNRELCESERRCFAGFVEKYKVYTPLWVYAYHFLGQYLDTATVTLVSAPRATLFVDAYGALRGSFLVAGHGYQADALALLRKVHESFVRAACCRLRPDKTLEIVRSQNIRKAERGLGLDLELAYRIESGFAHSNRLRSLNSAISVGDGKEPPRRYGPHVDEELHRVICALAVFWLHFGVALAPCLIAPTPAQAAWVMNQRDSEGLLLGYLRDAGSDLVEQCARVTELAARLRSSKDGPA